MKRKIIPLVILSALLLGALTTQQVTAQTPTNTPTVTPTIIPGCEDHRCTTEDGFYVLFPEEMMTIVGPVSGGTATGWAVTCPGDDVEYGIYAEFAGPTSYWGGSNTAYRTNSPNLFYGKMSGQFDEQGYYSGWGQYWQYYSGTNPLTSFMGPRHQLELLGFRSELAITRGETTLYIDGWDTDGGNPAYDGSYIWLWERNNTGAPTNVYGICKGNENPHEPVTGTGNVLQDGDMEQQPQSFHWFPETRNGYYSFGRFDSSGIGALGSSLRAACGSGAQIIGNLTCSSILDFFCLQARDRYADIRQRFTWPGGHLYFKYTAKGMPEGGWDRNVHALIYITNLTTFTQYVLRDDMLPPEYVTRVGSVVNVPAGVYNFYIVLGSGNAPGDAFVIDNVAVSQSLLDGEACSPVVPATTVTPTPSSGTATVTGTPQGVPGPNLIENCGFEQGEMGWRWQTSKSYVIYGPSNYSHAEPDAPLPGVSQSFFWPGGPMFVRYQSNSPHNVYIRHRFTNQTYMINAGDQTAAGWITYQGTTYVPGGSYDIYLHRPAGAWPVQYDNISVSEGNYSSCQSGANFTPTPPATATTTATPTMWPTSTQRATSTVMAGTSTSTPRPTNTPFPTFTTVPTLAETITPRPYSTFTPYPTYTQRPTYTPLPTYTPNGEGTIEPSATPTGTLAPQPPPDYYSDCQRPDTGDAAGWIEYNRCLTLSFFTWSPKAEATIIAMPTLVSGKEPFGTINEFKDTQDRMKELVDSYDWNTGMPGTSDSPDPSIFLNPGPDNPWFSGQIEFTQGTGTPISTECTARITAVLGPYLSAGYCWLVNFMQEKGITPWLQLLVNLSALGFLAAYLIRKWIDAGANSE